MAEVTEFRKAPELSPAQKRVEAIVKAAADLGMGGFALAKLRTVATEQINATAEHCAKLAAELAEKHRADGKPDMALASEMAAEAIRIFAAVS